MFRRWVRCHDRNRVNKPVISTNTTSTQSAINDLKAFRDIGETFNYLDTKMIVESHYSPYIHGGLAVITAAYKTDDGEIKRTTFSLKELTALRAENKDTNQ